MSTVAINGPGLRNLIENAENVNEIRRRIRKDTKHILRGEKLGSWFIRHSSYNKYLNNKTFRAMTGEKINPSFFECFYAIDYVSSDGDVLEIKHDLILKCRSGFCVPTIRGVNTDTIQIDTGLVYPSLEKVILALGFNMSDQRGIYTPESHDFNSYR